MKDVAKQPEIEPTGTKTKAKRPEKYFHGSAGFWSFDPAEGTDSDFFAKPRASVAGLKNPALDLLSNLITTILESGFLVFACCPSTQVHALLAMVSSSVLHSMGGMISIQVHRAIGIGNVRIALASGLVLLALSRPLTLAGESWARLPNGLDGC